MSYEQCLKIAGAKILAFKEFGDHRGDWWALVEYQDMLGWVNGTYGDDPSCDHFKSYFEAIYIAFEHKHGKIKYYNIFSNPLIDDCPICQLYKNKIIDFGKYYLNDIVSQKEAEHWASPHENWETTHGETLQWIINQGKNKQNKKKIKYNKQHQHLPL